MMSISNVSAGAAASGYYKEEGYYKSGSPEGEAASQWFGKAAEEIGLTGAVDDQQFAAFLDGQAPDGKVMGRWVEGERQHRPGLDLTFSASKSASIAGLVIGDERIVKAHDSAVQAAMAVVEERFIKTRWYEDGDLKAGAGQGIIAGIYRHDTSRALDPNLHSHAVVANMVKNSEGGYTALTNEAVFNNRKLITEIYRDAFEGKMRDIGIATERGRYGEVNISGISEQVIEAFSKRRQEIMASLEGKGLEDTPENAAKATLATRAAKHKDLDRCELRAEWRKEALEAGLEKAELERGSVQSHVPAPEIPKDQQRPIDPERAVGILEKAKALVSGVALPDFGSTRRDAGTAVGLAVAHISERQSAYSRADLTVAAMRFSHGAGFAAVDKEIDNRLKDGRLIEGTEERGLLTDKASVALERSILTTLRSSSKAAGVQLEAYEERSPESTLAKKMAAGNTLSDGQKDAVLTSLTGQGRYVGVQGYAGTGKTFMMDRVAHYASQSGYKVKGYAPNHQAVHEMGSVLGSAETVAKVVTAERHHPKEVDNSKSILLVDEASMLSAKDMRSFMDYAERTNAARVVLVGDTQQLDAVAAGQPFAQMQEAGMRTAVMDEIRRQRDDTLKQAVYASIHREIGEAFARLDGNVQKIDDPRQEAAERYLDLPASERSQTRVLTLTNAARAEINEAVREGLRQEGTIGAKDIKLNGLQNRQFTETELADARSYAPGDVVQSLVTSRDFGLRKQETYVVREVNEKRNKLTVQHEGDGTKLTLPLAATFNRRELGKSLVAYQPEAREMAVGDQVRFRISDPENGIANGARARIVSLQDGTIEAEAKDGQRLTFEAKTLAARGVEHDYAATAHAVQGETVDRVIVAMNASERLVSQKSFYVEISRARDEAVLLTDDPDKLSKRIEKETGVRETALDVWVDGRLAGVRSVAEKGDLSKETGAKIDPEKTHSKDPNQDKDASHKDDKSKQMDPFNHRFSDPEIERDIKDVEKYAAQLIQREKEIIR